MLTGTRSNGESIEMIDPARINVIVAKRTYTLVSGASGAWHCDMDAAGIVELCGGAHLFNHRPANALGDKETYIRK